MLYISPEKAQNVTPTPIIITIMLISNCGCHANKKQILLS